MEIRKKGIYGGKEVIGIVISSVDTIEKVKEIFEKYRVIFAEGNTYPFREIIKAAGLKWDPLSKSWQLPENNLKKDILEYARFLLCDENIDGLIRGCAAGDKEKIRRAWRRVLIGEGVPEDVANRVLDEAGM